MKLHAIYGIIRAFQQLELNQSNVALEKSTFNVLCFLCASFALKCLKDYPNSTRSTMIFIYDPVRNSRRATLFNESVFHVIQALLRGLLDYN